MKKLSVYTLDRNEENVALEISDQCLHLPLDSYIETFDTVVHNWENLHGYTVDSGGDEETDEFTVLDFPIVDLAIEYPDNYIDHLKQLLGGLFAQLLMAAREVEKENSLSND